MSRPPDRPLLCCSRQKDPQRQARNVQSHTRRSGPSGPDWERWVVWTVTPDIEEATGHLKLARSLSKSDSDLLASPHCEDDGGRSESLSNCAAERKEMEQMPLFASEWDEVRADELQIKELRRENTRLPLMRDKPEQTCSKFWIYTESYF